MSNTPSIENDGEHIEAREEALEQKQLEDIKKATFGEEPLKEPVTPPIQEPQYAPTNIDELSKRILVLPYEIHAYELKLLSCNNKDDYITKRSQEIKDQLYLTVSNEKSEGTFKYPDDVSREAEANKRLKESKLWKEREAAIYQEVTAEGDGEGKAVYTNEKARKSETTKRIYLDSQIKALNARILESVWQEKEEGKQLFTNEKAREIEVQRRLNSNTEYQLLMKEQKENVSLTHRTKSEIDLKRRESRSIEIITELMKIKLRIA